MSIHYLTKNTVFFPSDEELLVLLGKRFNTAEVPPFPLVFDKNEPGTVYLFIDDILYQVLKKPQRKLIKKKVLIGGSPVIEIRKSIKAKQGNKNIEIQAVSLNGRFTYCDREMRVLKVLQNKDRSIRVLAEENNSLEKQQKNIVGAKVIKILASQK